MSTREGDLVRMLAKATVRLGILRDRMESCDAESGDDTHRLSLFEITGWIEEQTALLKAVPR